MTASGIILPILLFLFKYILPAKFEKALTEDKSARKRILVELIHFPSELLMVAMSYTFPKTIGYIVSLSTLDDNEIKNSLILGLIANMIFSFVILVGMPFMVAEVETTSKKYFAKEYKSVIARSSISYIISLVLIILAVFLGG